MNVAHTPSKSRINIQIICGFLSEIKSNINFILGYKIYNIISITYQELNDQNSKIDYLLTTEDNCM